MQRTGAVYTFKLNYMKPNYHTEIKQGTPEWHALRCGVFTASTIGQLLTAKGDIAENATSRALINRIARERISKRKEDTFETFDMARGKEMEPIARAYYEGIYKVEVAQVGFVTTDLDGITIGCSPDGLVGEEGMMQIKSRKPSIHFDEVLSGSVPKGDLPQIQFELMVTDRAWSDYVSFCDGWPLFVKRVLPDPDMQETLKEAVRRAEAEVVKVIAAYQSAAFDFAWTEKISDADNEQLT